MVYFISMEKKKTYLKKFYFADLLAISIIIPLLVLKWIGDLIISIGKIFLSVKTVTYNKVRLLTSALNNNLPNQTARSQRLNQTLDQCDVMIDKAFHCFLSWINNLVKSALNTALRKILLQFLSLKSYFGKEKIIYIQKPEFPNLHIKFPQLPDYSLQIRKLKKALKLFLLKLKYFLLGSLAVGTIALIYQINIIVKSLPNPSYLVFRDIPTTTKIYDRTGKLLYEIYAEENRTPVALSQVPDIVKQATIAIEDRDFYSHQGYSTRGIIRAIINNYNSGTLQGGSTITQQLVRSALLTPEKTLIRKIKEFVLSLWTEHIYNKDQILEMYLNQVPYGGTSWGIEAASETYFGKKVQELTLSEAALLAGLPAAPSVYSPFGAHPELAKIRQEKVLDEMAQDGFISDKENETAKKQELIYRRQTIPIAAPHFVMYVKDLLEQYFGTRMVEKGGLRVTTTLDISLQEKVQKIVTAQIANLRPLRVGNGAVLITDPNTGQILTMVGSADYFDREKEGNVNLTTSLRQPGSSIKIVTYAAALNSGFTAASIINDSPISYRVIGQPPYSPANYDGKFHGNIPLRIALASSYNVPAVKVLSAIGVKAMIDQGMLMGITSWNDETRFGLSLTLGGGEVTMVDMAKVYGTLAHGGKRIDLTPFINITNYRGETLTPLFPQNDVQATSPEIAFILNSILSDNRARTPAFGPNSSLVIPGKTVAVKTGTSDNKRDNWTIGYTPDYVVTVWVGNNDNTPMHPQLTSGVTGAAPIWNEVTKTILEGKPDKLFLQPEGILSMPCLGRVEYFIRGTQPKGGCVMPPTSTPKPTE